MLRGMLRKHVHALFSKYAYSSISSHFFFLFTVFGSAPIDISRILPQNFRDVAVALEQFKMNSAIDIILLS